MSCGTSGGSTTTAYSTSSNLLPICTDPNSVRYIRVAFHYLLKESNFNWSFKDDCTPPYTTFLNYTGPGNFTETSDGYQNAVYNGFLRAEDVVGAANVELASNYFPWRKEPGVSYPADNNPPHTNLRYILVGTYFHRDNAAYMLSISRDSIHSKYNVGGNTVLDVYFTPNGDWSGIASGIGGSNKQVFMNCYNKYLEPGCRTWSLQYEASLLNHEIGHTLSLSHTWNEDDNCIDTPKGFIYNKIQVAPYPPCVQDYAHCWRYDPSLPGCPLKPCDDWNKVSNNIMDYNEYYLQHCYTVCQVARINTELLGNNGNSYIHSCNSCLPSNAFFSMASEYNLCYDAMYGYSVVLNGQGSFNENKYLIEICQPSTSSSTTLPTSTTCFSNYFSSGWMNGSIARVNLANLYAFQPNKYYKIKLTVDNTDCPGSSSYEQVIHTKSCSSGNESVDFVVLNPFSDNLSVHHTTVEQAQVAINLVNTFSGQVTQLLPLTVLDAGDYQVDKSVSALSSGTYSVVVIYNGHTYSKTAIKL